MFLSKLILLLISIFHSHSALIFPESLLFPTSSYTANFSAYPQYSHNSSYTRFLTSLPKLTVLNSNSSYFNTNLLLILSDQCDLSYSFECLTRNSNSITPSGSMLPLRYLFPNSSSESLIEFLGYSLDPIFLDIQYLTPGGFYREDYPSSDWTSIPTPMPISNLYFTEHQARISSAFYGYIQSPVDGNVTFSLMNEDSVEVWIDNELFYAAKSSVGFINTPEYNMKVNQIYYIKIKLMREYEGNYTLKLKWNIGTFKSNIDTQLFMYPTRISSSPYMLNSLKYDTLCEIGTDIKCKSCSGLCSNCTRDMSSIVCRGCKDNASLENGECICNKGFYEIEDICEQCDIGCKECDSIIKCVECEEEFRLENGKCEKIEICGKLCFRCEEGKCKECKENTRLENGVCKCEMGFYRRDQECSACDGLCRDCEELDGDLVCYRCRENARLYLGKCECENGYYLPTTLSMECKPCDPLCSSCIEENNSLICTSCIPNSFLSLNRCICNSSFYPSSLNLCSPCPSLCTTCTESSFLPICSSCDEHAYLSDTSCLCISGYYLSQSLSKCIQCPDSNCETCIESDKGIICTECKLPYSLVNNQCICNSEYYNTVEGECIYIGLRLSILPTENTVNLFFSSSILQDLNNSTINHTILESDKIPVISVEFLTVYPGRSYRYIYTSIYDIHTNITANITIYNTLYDISNSYIDPASYIVPVPIAINAGKNYQDDKNLTCSNTNIDQDSSSIENSTQLGLAICIGGVTLLSIYSKNLYSLWFILKTIQIFAYIPILNLDIPPKLKAFATGLSMPIIPNVFKIFVPAPNSELPVRYIDFGYDSSSFILNSNKTLTSFSIVLTVYLFLKLINLVLNYKKTKLKLISILISHFELRVFIRFVIQSYLELGITSSVGLRFVIYIQANFSSASNILDFILSLLCFIGCVLLLIFTIIFIELKHTSFDLPSFIQKWGEFYDEIDYKESKTKCYTIVIYLVRRVIYYLTLIFFTKSPMLQIGMCCGSSLLVMNIQVLGYLIIFKPYEKRSQLRIEVFIEICTLIVFGMMSVFVYVREGDVIEIVEWSVIGIMLMSVGVIVGLKVVRIVEIIVRKARRIRSGRRTFHNETMMKYRESMSEIDVGSIDIGSTGADFNFFYSVKRRRVRPELQ